MEAGQDKIFSFELLADADLILLHEWLNRPHISANWNGPCSQQEVNDRYRSNMSDPNVSPYMVLYGNEPFGFMQSYWAAKVGGGWWSDIEDDGTVGIDYFIAGASHIGKGLGQQMIKAFIAKLFADPAVTRIIADPVPDNYRSVKCLEKIGFTRIGLVETPDGTSLLMQLERGPG